MAHIRRQEENGDKNKPVFEQSDGGLENRGQSQGHYQNTGVHCQEQQRIGTTKTDQ